MPKIMFTETRKVQQNDGLGETFEAGKVYLLPRASCDRWKLRGIAVDAPDDASAVNDPSTVAVAALRDDGPTIAEYVAKGYPASKYPPKGYASRSTQEEIEEAVNAENAAKALEAMRAELTKMTNAQLHELAAGEKVAVETDDNKAALVDKIMAARAVSAAE